MPCVKQELAHDRLAEIAVGLFDQQQIAEIPDVTVKGKPIRIATRVFDLTRQIQPKRGLADQVQRGIRQRDVFFQHGGVAAPFRDAVSQNKGVIPHPA